MHICWMKTPNPQNSSQELHKFLLWVSITLTIFCGCFCDSINCSLLSTACYEHTYKMPTKLCGGRGTPGMDQNIQINLFTYLLNSSHLNAVLTEKWKTNTYKKAGLSRKLFSWQISFASCAKILIFLMIHSAGTQYSLLHPSLHNYIWYTEIIGYESYFSTHDLICGASVTSFVPKCLYTHSILLSFCSSLNFWRHASNCVSAVPCNWTKDGVWAFICDHLKFLKQLLRLQENNPSMRLYFWCTS